jgi:uncharacterized cofD-like protein
VSRFLQHRFAEDVPASAAHPVGNLLLTALTQVTGDFAKAIDQLGGLLGSRGRVLPTTLENVRLSARMESGETVIGETAIVERPSRIARLSLTPSPRPMPDVLRALVNADAIVVGPGSLYTSVLPNLLVEGVAATMWGVDAVRIYVANLMTQPGETDGYSVDDHLRVIREHTGFDLFDYILVHNGTFDGAAIGHYGEQHSEPVARPCTLKYAGKARIVASNIAPRCSDGKIRHDTRALAQAIRRLADAGRRRG